MTKQDDRTDWSTYVLRSVAACLLLAGSAAAVWLSRWQPPPGPEPMPNTAIGKQWGQDWTDGTPLEIETLNESEWSYGDWTTGSWNIQIGCGPDSEYDPVNKRCAHKPGAHVFGVPPDYSWCTDAPVQMDFPSMPGTWCNYIEGGQQ